MSKLTKAQRWALGLMNDIGSMYPCKAAGHTNTFAAMVRQGMATRIGENGPFTITDLGRAALSGEQP